MGTMNGAGPVSVPFTRRRAMTKAWVARVPSAPIHHFVAERVGVCTTNSYNEPNEPNEPEVS
jgi:hypothetical protein